MQKLTLKFVKKEGDRINYSDLECNLVCSGTKYKQDNLIVCT